MSERILPGDRAMDRILTAANVITAARLCAVPLAAWLVLRGQAAAAFWVFAAAGVSDAIDGWLARHGGGSRLGAWLDPIADKALIATLCLSLAAIRALPVWLALLIVCRDALIIGGIAALATRGRVLTIRPSPLSKLNTALQLLLLALVLADAGYRLGAGAVIAGLVWIVTSTTLASGAIYVWQTARAR
jgi:cardiolipin synthase